MISAAELAAKSEGFPEAALAVRGLKKKDDFHICSFCLNNIFLLGLGDSLARNRKVLAKSRKTAR